MVDSNNGAVKLLSDDEVAEIEARKKAHEHGNIVLLSVDERDALCATVRALRDESMAMQAEWEEFKQDREESDLGYMSQVDTYANANERVAAENTALREQLAQVTQERDEYRERLLKATETEVEI